MFAKDFWQTLHIEVYLLLFFTIVNSSVTQKSDIFLPAMVAAVDSTQNTIK